MSKAEIFSGICGFATTVTVKMAGTACTVAVASDCDAVQQIVFYKDCLRFLYEPL